MAPETIRDHLQQVLQTENVPADVQSLRLVARAARGSMRDALSLTDQAIAFGSGQLQEATVRLMLGSVDRSYVFRLLEALAHGDGKSVVETSEMLRLNGLSAASTLEEMSSVLQRMAVLQAVPSAMDTDDTDPEAADVARLAALMPADETQLLYSLCLHGRGELGLAPDEYAALTMVLLRLLAFKPRADLGTLAEKKTLNRPPVDVPRVVPVTLAVPLPTSAAAPPSFAPAAAPPGTQTLVPVQLAPVPVSLPVPSSQPAPTTAPMAPAAALRTQPWDDEPTRDPALVVLVSAAMDSEVTPAADLSSPPGRQLPVRAMPPAPSALATPVSDPTSTAPVLAPVATRIEPIPVRVQADSRAEAVAAQAAPAVLVPSEEGEFWHATVQQLIQAEAITALVRELALQSQLVARDTDQWLLRLERESLNQPGTRDRLSTALQAAGFGVRLMVEVGRVTDSPARRNAALAAERQLAAEKIIFDDPFVQAMMRDFGAKIVPGSIKPA
jgi:DNA polymerase-3 subunit gamma/tau